MGVAIVKIYFKVAAIAQWIRLHLPFFGLGLNTRHTNNAFSIYCLMLYWTCHYIVERTKIKQKQAGFGPCLQNTF